ncbi:MAG: arginine--tRNA ligase [Candidatus Algichlamydia australiensis]|nr:arginine--tRNA ligase [Chlamydiales bacterium]
MSPVSTTQAAKLLVEILKKRATSAIQKAFPDLQNEIAEVVPSTQERFGHYQCNSALRLAKQMRQNPREVAQAIMQNLPNEDELAIKMEIAGPGFINIFLNPSFLSERTNHLLHDPRLGVPKLASPKRMVVEFSSPNIAKELHVGHLRSTIIGDSLARLMEFLGHDVLRLNHIGDWGTQFGMLISYLKELQPEVLEGKKQAALKELMGWYRDAKKKFDKDPGFKKRSQEEVVRLQGGDEHSLSAWKKICEISRDAFKEIYGLLDVELIERGESFYNPFLASLVEDLEKKKLVTLSDGAKCIFLEGFVNKEGDPLPMIVQKSDGGYNYSTTDMAGMRHRIEKEKAERIVVVTDAGQSLHFQMIAAAAEKAGYLDPKKTQFDHVPFGVVLNTSGKKFKTREGATEPLVSLLTEGIAHAKKLLSERLHDDPELDQLATILGIDAIKYADLSCHRMKDYVFSYDRMLNFEGNTAAYLLYSYVRIQGIKRKVGKDLGEVQDLAKIMLEHPSEISLGLKLCQFGETLRVMERDLLPNRLTDYLYNLAESFHAFFRDCRVEGVDEENARLLLCEATARVLKQGLEILGLKTLDRM